jgi:TPR repeat protein
METGLDELHKDHKENAKIIFQKECDLGERSGCTQLGIILEKEEKNEAANSLFKKACDLGELRSCSNLGIIYLKQQKLTEAKVLLEKSFTNILQSQLFLSLIKYLENDPKEAKKIF